MKFRRDDKLKTVEVNLTPLIDVVFLLLIFFMISTTFDKQSQLEITLPEATSGEQTEQQPTVLGVGIDANGEYFLNQQALMRSDEDTLRKAIKKVMNGNKDLPVIISADGKAPHQSVITVLDVASQLGLNKMTFATSDKSN